MYGFSFTSGDAKELFGHHDGERKTGWEFVIAMVSRKWYGGRCGLVAGCGLWEDTTSARRRVLARRTVPGLKEGVLWLR